MTSGKTSSAPDDVTFVFLDANVVAKPVTRTLLMVGASASSRPSSRGSDSICANASVSRACASSRSSW